MAVLQARGVPRYSHASFPAFGAAVAQTAREVRARANGFRASAPLGPRPAVAVALVALASRAAIVIGRRRMAVTGQPRYTREMALTEEQQRALALLREGLSTAQVAERLGLPRPTVWLWQNELPEFDGSVLAAREGRAPLGFRDVVRIAAPLLLLLLAGLFFYYGY